MINILLGGLSRICFLLHSLRLGLEEVDPVGATGDALGAFADLGEALEREDLVLEGVGCPDDPPEVDVLWDGELRVTLVLVQDVLVCSIPTTTWLDSLLSSTSEFSVFSDTLSSF